jgi:hypothetical protein
MLNRVETIQGDGNLIYETVPIKPMSTEKAVKILVNGLRKNKMPFFVPWYAKFYYHFQRIAPGSFSKAP